MNRIYRSVWNEISRTFVAAAETVRGRGKPASSCAEATPASRSGAVLARRRPMMLALEQRFMFDGAAAAPVAEAAAAAVAAEAHAAVANAIADAPAPVEVRAADPAKDGGKKEVVFVDTSVADYKTLEAGIRDGVAIVEIDGAKDGLAQIAQWAEANSGYDSISILGHGSAATLNLGTTTLTSASLASSAVQTELAEIGQALTSDGDLMLYGCDVAKGTAGEKFIADLAAATGADVAASSDATGSASKGGDWVLEASAGTIEVNSALDSQRLAAYDDVLANATLRFESGTGGFSGADTTAMTFIESGSGATFTFSAKTVSDADDTVALGSVWGSSSAHHDSESVYFGCVQAAKSATMTIETGKVFSLSSFYLSNQSDTQTFVITTSKGGSYTTAAVVGTAASSAQITLPSTAAFQGITWFTITASSPNGAYMEIDDIALSNIVSPPTFSEQYLHSFYDTEVTNSFGNVSGTLTATPVGSANIVAYGISGTAAGGTDIGGKYYEISQVGTYGTLYIKAMTGAYVYVPNSSAIEAISTETVGGYANRVTRVDSFTVTATDSVGATATNVVSIDLTGQNDTPEVTSGATASVAENSSGTVYTATASDRDSGQTLTYSLSGTDAGLFNINPSTGEVSFKTAPDYENPADSGGDNVYDINVIATDNAAIVPAAPVPNDSAPKAVHINVTDADEAPVFSSGATGSVAENGAAGAVVYTAVAADPEHGAVTYSVSGTDAAAFTIDGTTGQLKINAAADYETQSSYSIRIEASDGNLIGYKDVTIDVSDVNDKPVITVSPQVTQNVDQGLPTPITGISVADADAGNDNIVVALWVLNGNGTLTATAISGVLVIGSGGDSIELGGRRTAINEFIAAGKLGYTSAAGATGDVTVWIDADDTALDNNEADRRTLTLKIIEPNAAPVLADGSPALTGITEKDTGNAGQTVESFAGASISDTNSGALKGIAITGLAAGNGAWQYSTDAGATWTAVGTVSETSALLLRASDSIRFVPNGVAGTAASITYRAWDQTSGTAGDKANTATNGGETAFSAKTDSASIAVSDVNDAPTGVSITNATVSAFDSDNTVVGALSATDVDSSSFTYTVVSVSLGGASQDNALFNVSGSNLCAAQPGSLQAGTYSVVVEVSDGDKTHQQTLSVTVSDALTVTTAGDTGANATTGGSYAAELADGGGLSLREAVALAAARTGGATIRFAAGVSTVTFNSLTIGSDITIDTDAQPAMTIEGSFNIAAGKTLTFSNGSGDKLTLHSINGTGTFVKAGSGTLTLAGSVDCGVIRVDGGTLALGDEGTFDNSVGVSLTNGTTLAVSATKTLANAITLDGSATIDTGDATLTLKKSIYGHGGLIKAGNGTLIVGWNDFSGTTTTTVNGGTLSIESVSSLGGAISLADGTTLAVRSATKIYSAISLTGSATISADDALTLKGAISGTGSLVKTGAGALTLSGTNSYSGTTTVSAGDLAISSDGNLGGGNVSLAGGTKLTVSNAAALTLSGTISGTGGLTKDGSGTLTLAGANSYSGPTTINDGTLAVAGYANLGTGSVILNNDATLAVSGTTTINNEIVVNYDATIATDANVTATLSGNVTGSSITTLTKAGAGTLTLIGTCGTAMKVATGTLQVGGGIIAGTLTIDSGATLAPGVAGVGTLTLGGALTLNGTLAIEIASNTSYDAISANGISYGTGSTISVTCIGGYAPSSATSFLLIDNRSATSGAFTGLAQDALLKSGDNDYTVSYTASGNAGGSTSLTLTSLPRPAVSGVTSSAGDGLHKIGDVVTISVAFDRAVNVAGTPTLLLETGTTDRLARYLSGSGTGVLTFTYTVQAGDTAADLDYASTGALALAGGTIVDAQTGKPAVLTLAAPGVTGSLAASKAIVIDGNAPTASIVLSSPSLRIGETAQVIITFSEAVTGFDASDLSVANGTLSGLSTSDNITWSATFTPTAGISDTSKVITLANAGLTDLAGNAGAGVTASANYAVDTLRPTATIVVADSVLAAGETSQVTITFSEAVSGFTNADLSVASGTLSGLSSSDGGVTWSATFTPSADVSDTSNLITLSNSGVADLAGNAGSGTSDSNNYVVDTLRPTATISVAQSALKADDSALVTITFSEAVIGFTNADLSVANGTLSAVTSSDGGITWSATFTPNANVADSSNVITLNSAGVTDLAGSAGSGASDSNNYAIDSVRPTATIVLADRSLTIGETTQVTITFSEAVSGFDASDLAVANGTLSGLASTDGGITWSATFTPSAEVTDTSNVITLNDHSVENSSGNANSGAATSANYAVLTARTLSYSATTLAEAAANDGSISTTVTITLANESFSGADGGALGTVANVPAGLTAQLIKVDATHARLTLSGKASAHANAQDIGNLMVSFADGDFVGSPAAKVAGATTTLAIDFADAAAVPPPPVVAPVVPAPVVVTPPIVLEPPVVVLPPASVTPPASVVAAAPPAPATPDPVVDTVQFIAPASPLALAASPQADSSQASLTAPQLAAAAVAPAEAARAPLALASTSEGSSPAPAMTQGGGFQVVVASGAVSPTDGLVVNRGVADQSVGSGTVSQFAIPADAFAASSAGAVVTLSAQQSNGAPLPSWVRFDAASGRFEGQPPAGFTGELTIRVVARDAQGHEAVTTFKIKVGDKSARTQPERPGRAGLTEQLRLIGRPHPALERLARLAAWRNAA